MLKVRVVVLLPEDGGLVVKAGFPPEDMLDEADLAAARWCFDRNQATGRGADTLPGAKRRFMPLRTGRGAVGIVGIDSDKPGLLLTPEESRLLDARIRLLWRSTESISPKTLTALVWRRRPIDCARPC